MNTTNKLNEVVDYLNKRFNQGTNEYNIVEGAKPQVIRFDKTTAISTWACGAVVCIGSILHFISEDDGHWYLNESNKGYIGFQQNFSIGWSNSFIKAIANLNRYVEENGEPVRYTLGKDEDGSTIYGTICYYKLV